MDIELLVDEPFRLSVLGIANFFLLVCSTAEIQISILLTDARFDATRTRQM